VSTSNVVNPGLVSVADQGDGPVVVDQAVSVARPSTNSGPTARGLAYADGPVVVDQEIKVTSPSTNSGPTARGLDYADGEVKVDQPVTVSPPMTAGRSVNGGLDSPLRPGAAEVTQNNVAGQVYGVGTPANVFV
jgi:hypothetical protein